MTCIDTIELTTHTDYIGSLKRGCFNVSKTLTPNGQVITKYPLKNKIIGLRGITINQNQQTVRINASSKILGSNYPKGININTLDQFIDEVAKNGLELKKDFIKDCKLNRLDIKNDIQFEKEVNLYINTLNQLNAFKFVKTNYNSGIVFKEKIKTNPIIFTGYSKSHEISLNKDFYKQYPIVTNYFNNTLRIETKLQGTKTIKKHFRTKNLLEMLTFVNFNLYVLNKIIDNQTSFKPLFNTSKMTNTQEKNFSQIYYLNEYYNGDYHKIINHIKNKLGKNTKASYQRKKVKEYLSMINNTPNDFLTNLDEIKRKLKE